MPENPRIETPNEAGPWHPVAAAAGFVVPGLGHVLLKQPRRGVILGVAITSLWFVGVLVGGISVLDAYQHPFWSYPQRMIGLSVAGNHYLQTQLKRPTDQFSFTDTSVPHPGRPHRYQPSFGRMSEQGVLFTALAGMLNLLAILDVAYKDPKRLAARIAAETSPAAKPSAPASTNHVSTVTGEIT